MYIKNYILYVKYYIYIIYNMLFKLTLILLLVIFIIFIVIYYMYSYKRLIIINESTYMGPLTKLSIDKANKMDTDLSDEQDNMYDEVLKYDSLNLDDPLLTKQFENNKLSLYHNDFGYSYTFFIKIDDLNYKHTQEKEIFSKGRDFYNPRVSLDKKLNNLKISIDTYTLTGAQETPDSNHYTEDCIIEDIPIQTWVFVGIVVHDKTLDVYINGNIIKSHTLEKIPKKVQNIITYGDKGGFDGSLNKLIYYFYPLSSLDILNIFNKSKGVMNDTTNTKKKLNKLLSLVKTKQEIKTCYE
jgi:hypothetical protein